MPGGGVGGRPARSPDPDPELAGGHTTLPTTTLATAVPAVAAVAAVATPPPPLCWCRRPYTAHLAPTARDRGDTADVGHDHDYVPAAGVESEAYQAW